MCFVYTCWERADLLALVCGVYCEFVTFPLVSWVRCGTWLYRFQIFAPLLTFVIWLFNYEWHFSTFIFIQVLATRYRILKCIYILWIWNVKFKGSAMLEETPYLAGRGDFVVILVRVCEPVFWNQSQSYSWPLKENSPFIYLILQKDDLLIHLFS